jgi:hypothetical protein
MSESAKRKLKENKRGLELSKEKVKMEVIDGFVAVLIS